MYGGESYEGGENNANGKGQGSGYAQKAMGTAMQK
jgi:hypothetical protein